MKKSAAYTWTFTVLYLEVAEYLGKGKINHVNRASKLFNLREAVTGIGHSAKTRSSLQRPSRLKHAYLKYVQADLESLGSNDYFGSKFRWVSAKKYMSVEV